MPAENRRVFGQFVERKELPFVTAVGSLRGVVSNCSLSCLLHTRYQPPHYHTHGPFPLFGVRQNMQNAQKILKATFPKRVSNHCRHAVQSHCSCRPNSAAKNCGGFSFAAKQLPQTLPFSFAFPSDNATRVGASKGSDDVSKA